MARIHKATAERTSVAAAYYRRMSATVAEALNAFNLRRWIDDNKAAFSGPVANNEVFPQSELIFQIIRGPNARSDFHVDPGDEIDVEAVDDLRRRHFAANPVV